MTQRKPHTILGVASDASEEEIRAAFRKAAKKYHPDKKTNPEDKEKANLKFNQINEAYESLMSQFQSNNYSGEGVEGEQDLNEPAPSRVRPKEGGRKVRKRSGASSARNLNEQPERPSSFRSTGNNRASSPPITRKESVKTRRRSKSATNSPGVNQQSKRSLRSPGGMASPGARSPGSLSGRKSIRDNLKSPTSTTGRPRPSVVQRNSSAPTPREHRRSKSALAGNAPPRPPLETSPTVTRKKTASPMNSPISPNRKPASMRKSTRNVGDVSLSPHRLKTRKGHVRHSSAGAINYNHVLPAPPMGGSPKRTNSSGNLKSLRKSTAPPPPQSAMQRLSMKITNRSELKAEKKARAEKLMA